MAAVQAQGLPREAGPGISIELLLSEPTGVHVQLAQMLQSAWSAWGWTVALIQAGTPSPAKIPDVVVTLGGRALREARQRARERSMWAQVPLLAALLPLSVWRSEGVSLPVGSSAIWLDQPIDRFVELARLALPQRRRLGVVWGPVSRTGAPDLLRATQARSLTVAQATVQDPATDLFAALQQVLSASDVLLAQPDPVVYNAESLQNILIATYRQRVPMISFTAAHARAGATLALHTPLEEVAAQVGRALQRLARSGSLPAPSGAEGFAVVVNAQVARSLSLDMRTEAQLQAALRSALGAEGVGT